MNIDRATAAQARMKHRKPKSGPPVRSSELVGRCVEVGDDAEGQPRLIIHTTREQLKNFGRNLIYSNVVVTIAPPNEQAHRSAPGVTVERKGNDGKSNNDCGVMERKSGL
jgi:hypothetical protein